MESQDTVEACMFLVGYYRHNLNFAKCEAFATRLLQYGGPEKEEAKALLREIRNLQSKCDGEGSSLHESDSSGDRDMELSD